MGQHHAAGDKVFVDYSGKKIGIVDPETECRLVLASECQPLSTPIKTLRSA
jgi:hypothetical protein